MKEKPLAKCFYLAEGKDNLVMSKLRCCDEPHSSYPIVSLLQWVEAGSVGETAVARTDTSPTHVLEKDNLTGEGEANAWAKPTD